MITIDPNNISYTKTNLEEELTDGIVITKRFRSQNEFSLYIEERVTQDKIGYMEAIINYCDEIDIEIASIASMINKNLKEKIKLEAEEQNLLRKRSKLPI